SVDRAQYHFAIMKFTKEGTNWVSVELANSGGKPIPGLDVNDFFDFFFSAIGDKLTIRVNGHPVIEARDTEYKEGAVRVGTWQSKGHFKDVEVKISDD